MKKTCIYLFAVLATAVCLAVSPVCLASSPVGAMEPVPEEAQKAQETKAVQATEDMQETQDAQETQGVQDAQDVQDAVTMYLIKHTAQIHLQNGIVTLDGEYFGKERIQFRNNRAFVPVRLLKDLNIGAIEWDAKHREVKVTIAEELGAPAQTAVYRVGSEHLYTEDRTAIPDVTISPPFLEQGRVFIPLQHLSRLGVSVEFHKPYMTLHWTEKKFKIHTPVIEAKAGQARFTVLYESDMEAPIVLMYSGGGGWSGSSKFRKIIEQEIFKDGRTYTRMEYTVPLRPGPNPILLSGVIGQIVLETFWQPETDEEVPLYVFEEWPVVFDLPRYGYVTAFEGEAVSVAGTIILENDLMDEITLQLEKYDPVNKTYFQVEEIKIPIVGNQFSDAFPAPKPGTYLVHVYSPKYIPYIGGPASTKWTQFVLDVQPSGR